MARSPGLASSRGPVLAPRPGARRVFIGLGAGFEDGQGFGVLLPAAGQFLYRGPAHGSLHRSGRGLEDEQGLGILFFQPRASSRTAAWRTQESSSEWARALSHGKLSGPLSSRGPVLYRGPARRSLHRTGRGL
jgi:hypothetical protein